MRIGKLCALLLLLLVTPVHALNQVKGMRIWPSPESTRVVFDIEKGIHYKVYKLHAPDRVVIDLRNTKLNTDLARVPIKNSGIKKLRSGVHPDNMLRIVLELDHTVSINSFVLEPNDSYGDRLVVDLEATNKQAILALFDLDAKTKAPPPPQSFIIAIDPGHGGEDPGAVGPRGTREKDVALAIAKKLKDIINKQPGMQAFLIRNGDYYLGFRERMNRARSKHADLFISIHADAFINSKADGASVFVLSTSKASSVAARWLVASENRADLVGGVSLRKNDQLAAVIFDLTQTANFAASMEASRHVLQHIGKTTKLHKNKVESGPFLVLRSPDIPSLLVETGFLSNPKTELKLRDQKYQEQIATSIMHGVKAYFKNKTKMPVVHK
jgi:N-acetylmuramoyl-L-alanine amidase